MIQLLLATALMGVVLTFNPLSESLKNIVWDTGCAWPVCAVKINVPGVGSRMVDDTTFSETEILWVWVPPPVVLIVMVPL